jgi:two-component system, chemotaxis family, sensor kinase CheA
MVISQSLVRHDPDLATGLKPRLARNLSQLARITDDIQRTAMSMRMIPVGQLFQKTSRLVRDLSRKAAKQVELELAGEETELDRNIVEELADPLMHMVRNSVDHGIETPAERVAAGKPALAHVRLKAGHQAGHIVIEVSDDGRGLAREKILRKARDQGLLAAGAELEESEIFALIFQPGFSTADKITDVSGRGVGMDVVRKQVQKLRGRIDVLSKPGQGTTFLMKLPLTLAIIDGLVVGVGDQRYIVPLFAVREMLQPSEQAISTIHGRQEMAMVRGTLLPVIRLHQRFHVTPRRQHPWESLLIVSESGSKLFCLMVDELIGKQEVVIKSLGEGMRNIPGVAGGAILGDGRVGLILDPEGLFGARNGAGHGD